MRLLLAIATLLTTATASEACSPPRPGAPLPRGMTNVELVQRADLVVLARVSDKSVTAPFPEVEITPIRVIKGAPTQQPLFVRGRFIGLNEHPAIFPTGLAGSHPSSRWGSCFRAGYVPGALVVATFTGGAGVYTQITASRAVEDVEGPDDIWVRAADLYAKALGGAGDPRKALEAEKRRLEELTNDPAAQDIAADIGQYLTLTAQ